MHFASVTTLVAACIIFLEQTMKTAISKPTKEQVRAYMQERSKRTNAIPTQSEIRRRLGWFLVPLALVASSANAGSYLVVCNPGVHTHDQTKAHHCDVFTYSKDWYDVSRASITKPDLGRWETDQWGNMIFWISGTNGRVGLMVSDDNHE